jgi:uncharacterized protein YndB with AHSA1/START domain
MPANHYSFVTSWGIEAPLQAVWDVISSSHDLPSWWKAVLNVKTIQQGNDMGVGRLEEQTWKGVLPYQLTFLIKITAVDYLKSIEFTASGDLEGYGKWSFKPEEHGVTLQHTWEVKTTEKWLSILAPVAKPLLAWNHDEIMRWGAQGLAKKLNAPLIKS